MPLVRGKAQLVLATGAFCGVYAALQAGAWGFGRHQQIYEVAPDTSSLLERAVLTGDEAYIVLPAEPVSGPATHRAFWPSPDGNFLLVSRFKEFSPDSALFGQEIPSGTYYLPKGERTLTVWDVEKRQATALWRGETNEKQWAVAAPHGFFHQSTIAVAAMATGVQTSDTSVFDRKQNTLIAIDAKRGTTRTLGSASPQANLLFCPIAPKLAVVEPNGFVQIIHASGVKGRSFGPDVVQSEPSPVQSFSELFWVGWRDERTLVGERQAAPANIPTDSGSPRTPSTFLLNTETGVIREEKTVPECGIGPPPIRFSLPLQTEFGTAQLRSDSQQGPKLRPLWLTGKGKNSEGRVLLAPHAQLPLASPASFPFPFGPAHPIFLPKAVLFESQGILFAAPLVRMNREEFVTAKAQAYQRLTVFRAGQISVGLQGYAQQYNGQLPPPGSDVNVLARFINSSTDSVDFLETGQFALTLSYTQSNLSDYKNPYTDVLGYLTGPSGRAVIYVSGRVSWESKP